MKDIGLVLEGGGMRGIYTAGVLDFFMDKNFYLPYVIGVSAGACQGVSYVSRQRGRGKNAILNLQSLKQSSVCNPNSRCSWRTRARWRNSRLYTYKKGYC